MNNSTIVNTKKCCNLQQVGSMEVCNTVYKFYLFILINHTYSKNIFA